MSISLNKMRADIAEIIEVDAMQIGDHDNLADLGLDSLRLMRLVLGWEAEGLSVDFSIFAEFATLGDWWREISDIQPGS